MRNNDEHDIQCSIIEHARQRWPELKTLLFAIPNGGNRNIITGARLKREGVTSGVWDLQLAIGIKGYHSMWLEVKDPKYKKRKNGGLSASQFEWGIDMENQGHLMHIVYSCQDALDKIEDYLS